jgi:hypothetical protein
MKGKSEEGTATIWLTTAEMGFSLTEEQEAVVCTNDVKEEKIIDRFLAPAISQFAADMRRKVVTGADTDRQTTDVRGKLEDLHQRWDRANVTPNNEDIKAQAGNEAKVTNRFIRIIQRKDLPWEKNSIARAENDPEHIPDCNVQATVGQHFLFHEPISRPVNGQGYLRVTTEVIVVAA